MHRTDPFTRTPGVAGNAFINMHYADEIIGSFEDERSSKFVYKIVGLRGSGKSVEYSKIINYFAEKKNWLTYTLSAAGDPISTLIAKLSRESFIDNKIHGTSVSIGASAGADGLILKGNTDLGLTRTSEDNLLYYSPEAELSDMVDKANSKGFKILVGIDDIARTPEMVKFLSIWGAMLLEDRKRIYLVCTGLSKNIEDFTAEPNLTFFKRSDPVEIGSLNRYEISLMYQKLLGVDEKEAVKLSKFTCGYAYAYQVLGSLYYNKEKKDTLEDLIPQFDRILFGDSYDLIWKSLTKAERQLVRLIVLSDSGKVSQIKEKMNSPSGFDSLRNRLMNKHLINTEERGYIKIDLPRFREYVLLWHDGT